ncbi:hypothetical protein [Neobacillus rhizosphaerae]|nr:hypothetical protein [Neobacillus rhizosphaerae]
MPFHEENATDASYVIARMVPFSFSSEGITLYELPACTHELSPVSGGCGG